MNVIEVSAGLGTPSLAWRNLGWNTLLYSEIAAAPRLVLKQRHHAVDQRRYVTRCLQRNKPILWGDFTTLRPRHLRRLLGHANVDLLVGGTPCQSYSIAGKRGGLDDPRGELSLEFALLAFRLGVRWFVWENVPGVFSSSNGEDFAAILSAFTGREVEVPLDGWSNTGVIPEASPDHFGIAWGVRDAQYFGVPQRRRRVFVVGCLGDWRRAAAVLLELFGVQGNPAPSRQMGQRVTGTVSARPSGGGGLGTDFDLDGALVPTSTVCMATGQGSAEIGIGTTLNCNHEAPIVTCVDGRNEVDRVLTLAIRGRDGISSLEVNDDGVANTILTPNGGRAGIGVGAVAIAFRAAVQDGFSPSEIAPPLASTDGGGAGVPTIAFDCKASGRNGFGVGEVSPTLRAMGHKDSHTNAGGQVAIAISGRARGDDGRGYERAEHMSVDVASTLDGVKQDRVLGPNAMAVRRLTPLECERLQGLPDSFTAVKMPRNRWRAIDDDEVPYLAPQGHAVRQRPDGVWETNIIADGPRYKMIGNGMAEPVLRWIGERIAMVDAMEGAA